MLEVQIENIIPVTEARDKFNQIVDAVENTEELYVLTKNGKPAAIVVGIHHLEKLTGETHSAAFGGTTNNTAAAPTQQTAAPFASSPTDSAADAIFNAAPVSAATPGTPYPDPINEPAPTDFSAIPQAPAEQPQVPAAPATPTEAITFDSMPAQTLVSPVPVSIPQDNPATDLPIDSPLIDPSSPATGGQAIAPDAVTPDQAGPSADPFAIPSEPLDLPEDNQAQAAPTTDQN